MKTLVTLRGPTRKAIMALMAKLEQDAPTAIRAGLDEWLKTEGASDFYWKHGLDLAAIINGNTPGGNGK